MQFVRKSRLNFFILQIREIDFDVHSRSIDTSMHCEKANTDIRNRSWIASRSHFSQKVVGLRRGVHNPKWHLCRQLVSSLYRSCSRRSFLGGAFGNANAAITLFKAAVSSSNSKSISSFSCFAFTAQSLKYLTLFSQTQFP